MNVCIAILLATSFTGAASALVPTSIDNSPLKPICDRLCGGTWRSTQPPVPDQFVVSYTYQWDPALRAIRGTIVTTGGIAGVHEEAIEVFGYDSQTKMIWVLRADGDGTPVYGSVQTSDNGFSEILRPLGEESSTMTSSYTFTGVDAYTVISEIAANGSNTMGAPQTYRRGK